MKKKIVTKAKKGLTWALIAAMAVPHTAWAGTWHQDDRSAWYYQDENGNRQTGWVQENQNWYYMGPDGVMRTGWFLDDEQDRYYLNRAEDGMEGTMRVGWFFKDDHWYFLNTVHDGKYGRAISGCWQWIDGYCYLFDKDGAMYADCVTPDGYTVNREGRWTVNGAVQYVPGKGILTRRWTDSESGDDENRSSSTNQGIADGSGNSGNAGDNGNQGDTGDNGNQGDGTGDTEKPGNDAENPEKPGDDAEDPVNPGEGAENPEKPGDDTEDPEKPGDDAENPEKPGNDAENPEKPGDDAEDPEKPGDDTGDPEKPGDDTGDPEKPGEDTEDPGDDEKPADVVIFYTDQITGAVLETVTLTGIPGESMKIEHPAFEGYMVCQNQPDEIIVREDGNQVTVYYLKDSLSSTITIHYIVEDADSEYDGQELDAKKVVGENGELYVIQHPVFTGFKMQENQPDEARFSYTDQDIYLKYREKLETEEEDQSIVLVDNVKWIEASNEEDQQTLRRMREEILDYNVSEDGEIELAVGNGNPLLGYIYDGTIDVNDVVMITECEEFPLGVSFSYEGHSDDYSGFYEYDSDEYEVIYGTQLEFYDLLAEGTNYSFDLDELGEDYELEIVSVWSPDLNASQAEGSSRKSRRAVRNAGIMTAEEEPDFAEVGEVEQVSEGKLIEDGRTFELKYDKSFPIGKGEFEIESQTSFAINGARADFRLPSKSETSGRIMYIVEHTAKSETTFTAKMEGDLTGFLDKYLKAMEAPENKVEFKFWKYGGEFSGVDLSGKLDEEVNSYLLGLAGIKLLTKKGVFNVEDVFAKKATARTWDPVVAALLMLDMGLDGSVEAKVTFETEANTEVGFDVSFGKNEEVSEDEGLIFNITGKNGGPVTVDESVSLEANGKARLGVSVGLGASFFGVMPFLGRLQFGDEIEADVKGEAKLSQQLQAPYELEPKAEFEGSVVVDMYYGAYLDVKLVGAIKLPASMEAAVELDKRLWLISEKDDDGEDTFRKLNVFSWPPAIKWEEGTLRFTDEKMMTEGIEPLDENGNNIADQFGLCQYGDKIRPYQEDEDSDYIFIVPAYYKLDGKYYKTVKVDPVHSSTYDDWKFERLDMSRASELRSYGLSYSAREWVRHAIFPDSENLTELGLWDPIEIIDISRCNSLERLQIVQNFSSMFLLKRLIVSDKPGQFRDLQFFDFSMVMAEDVPELIEDLRVILEDAENLEHLNISGLIGLRELDISHMKNLKNQNDFGCGGCNLEIFRGNGMVMPSYNQRYPAGNMYDGWIEWYSDPEKTGYLVAGGTEFRKYDIIYSSLYEPESLISLFSTATPSNANAIAVLATVSDAVSVEKATPGNAVRLATDSDASSIDDDEDDDEDDIDDEIDLIDDRSLAMLRKRNRWWM